ncbi:hypothetical protein AG1IA_00643 [Rhizoctonia solani AG-1 IA]|uniref:Uncharacterized protein n=1 Tax=Thanatephorus cucumeris (strain AG1-IA) TaxID=983506 RepID=L8X561_THACA|nr:hypothetical protein AG1IA_00643 [Rhizoctonia solani AG-1 IA]
MNYERRLVSRSREEHYCWFIFAEIGSKHLLPINKQPHTAIITKRIDRARGTTYGQISGCQKLLHPSMYGLIIDWTPPILCHTRRLTEILEKYLQPYSHTSSLNLFGISIAQASLPSGIGASVCTTDIILGTLHERTKEDTHKAAPVSRSGMEGTKKLVDPTKVMVLSIPVPNHYVHNIHRLGYAPITSIISFGWSGLGSPLGYFSDFSTHTPMLVEEYLPSETSCQTMTGTENGPSPLLIVRTKTEIREIEGRPVRYRTVAYIRLEGTFRIYTSHFRPSDQEAIPALNYGGSGRRRP